MSDVLFYCFMALYSFSKNETLWPNLNQIQHLWNIQLNVAIQFYSFFKLNSTLYAEQGALGNLSQL